MLVVSYSNNVQDGSEVEVRRIQTVGVVLSQWGRDGKARRSSPSDKMRAVHRKGPPEMLPTVAPLLRLCDGQYARHAVEAGGGQLARSIIKV